MVITHFFDEFLEDIKEEEIAPNKEYTCYLCRGKLKLQSFSNVKYQYKKYICVDCGEVN